jgi:hypothetical protein
MPPVGGITYSDARKKNRVELHRFGGTASDGGQLATARSCRFGIASTSSAFARQPVRIGADKDPTSQRSRPGRIRIAGVAAAEPP